MSKDEGWYDIPLNTDREQSDIKASIELIQRHDANISGFFISLKGKLDRIEREQKHFNKVLFEQSCSLKRLEKLLEHVIIIEGYDLDKLKYRGDEGMTGRIERPKCDRCGNRVRAEESGLCICKDCFVDTVKRTMLGLIPDFKKKEEESTS